MVNETTFFGAPEESRARASDDRQRGNRLPIETKWASNGRTVVGILPPVRQRRSGYITWSRPGVQVLAAVAVSASSCAEPTPTGVDASICAPLTFRACDTPAGRGVQQCFDDGTGWSDCEFVLLDAHIGGDGAVEGGPDALDGSRALLDSATEALDIFDARLDGAADAVDDSVGPDGAAEGDLDTDSAGDKGIDGPPAD